VSGQLHIRKFTPGERSVVSCLYVFWKEQYSRTFRKMFTKCESSQEQETVAKSRLRVGALLLVFRLKQHPKSWHQNMWQYTWLICLSLSINWVILKHTALETLFCVCVCVYLSVCLSVSLSVSLSLGGKKKAEFYTFVSVRMCQYISESFKMSIYFFESVRASQYIF
jgi:hypothetical protein